MGERGLTPKQARFVEEYLLDLNATQAAIRAGYSKRTANAQAGRLLVNVSVKAAIERAQESRSARLRVDADYVLQRLVEIDQLDLGDILAPGGDLLPVSEWPDAWRRSAVACEIVAVKAGGDDVIANLKKIKWPDKLRALEMIGRHVDIHAWGERPAAGDSVADALRELAESLPV